MNAFDRIVSLLGGLLILAGAISLFILVSPYQNFLEYYWTSMLSILGVLEIVLIGLVILLISIRTLWIAFKREKKVDSVTKELELGEVKISLDAIETMVKQVAEQTKGVKDIQTKIRSQEDGVIIYFKGKVLPDVIIPELSEELQNDIKEHVETVSGIVVKEVKMLIENISNEKGKSINPKAKTRKKAVTKTETSRNLEVDDEKSNETKEEVLKETSENVENESNFMNEDNNTDKENYKNH
ncbi:alkaline shock response membrane anchor protein AmaP [Natranaerofaba carboxydovora]|uniref:alkaline shock response membrane anchor protein AmaP n=1 Tax=Natranaerofaba carboxydovora TaxID=2742683 RepID=UPI001F1417C7|nr:alkaline shock response membrane anchor protein AmaP [Natranaerofaba carboxydovora]UMZ73954.1 hypothetical protein ACONDI_01524 [Natranaerofaba carboxydovora]